MCLVVDVGSIVQVQGSKHSLNYILLKLKLLYLYPPYIHTVLLVLHTCIYLVYIFESSVYVVRTILEKNRQWDSINLMINGQE